jgi:superfamily I DNA and/or RNA helicase
VVKGCKTIAVVSNNNSAIENIHEKLQEYSVDFIVAKLGSTKNKEKFILKQHSPSKEKLESWLIDKLQDAENRASVLTNQINEILKSKNEMAKFLDELDDIKTEKRYFDEFSKVDKLIPLVLRKFVHSNKILDLWLELEGVEHKISRLPLWKKIKFYLIYKVKVDDFFKQSYSNMIMVIQKLYYDTRINEIKSQIKRLSDRIKANDIDEKISEHKKLSQIIFQSYLAKRYLKNDRIKYNLPEEIRKNSEDFIKDYPVVLSTTYSLRNSLDCNYIYDYVVIDESSQVDLATFVLVLSCAKHAVIVGDEKQLSNVVKNETRKIDEMIFSKYDISDKYKFSANNALSSVTALFGNEVPGRTLYEHYRCHPKIIGFCNKSFYDNQLIILTETTKNTCNPLKIYTTVKGNHARKNLNQREIDVTFDEIVMKEGFDLYNNSVGIVTPYVKQTDALNEKLGNIGAKKTVLAATVDKFQGRERDVIIINTVDNKISNFASNPNRLNVAVSRAKNQLIVVTNGNDHLAHNNISELIEYVKYNNFEIIKSDIRSIFDYLYTAYYKRRKVKKVSNYYSENLMFDLIEKVIKEEGYTNLKCATQYPLKMLCDISKLSGREREYATHSWTLVDFVLFKKTSKTPILTIEVDGWAYHHADNSKSNKQKERDSNKNNILKKFNIPLIRFSTTGSNERETLSKKLRELMRN